MLSGLSSLAGSLVLKLSEMVLHVHRLLGLVQGLQPSLKEGALHLVVSILGRADLQGRLVVPHLAGLPQDRDVSWRVDLLQDHFQLVEKPQSVASLLLHDLVHLLGVELDVEVPERWLKLLKVLHFGGDVVPNSKTRLSFKIQILTYFVENSEKLSCWLNL